MRARVPRVRWSTWSAGLLAISMLAPVLGHAAEAAATLRFFNRDIVTFNSPNFGLSPAERADRGAQRIREALAKGGPGAVSIAKVPEGLNVAVDGVYVFRVLEGDLDVEDGQTFDQAMTIVGGRLQEAIAAAQSSKRGRELLWAIALSVAAAVGLVVVIWAIAGARLWIRRSIDARLAHGSRMAQEERATVMRLIRAVGQAVFVVIVAVLVEEWLRLVFGLFPYTRPWATHLTGYVMGIAETVSGAIAAAVPGLVMVAVIAGLAEVCTKILSTIAGKIEARGYRVLGIDAEVAQPARRLATAAVWLFALAMAYPYLPGSGSDAFKGLSVLVGLMLSLGASGLVGQAAGGFILTFSRTLHTGDWVRVGEVEGAVMSVGMFSTKIRTFADEEVSIPNSVVLGTVTKNFSRPATSEASILETSVTIGYGAPWRQVHAMLLEAAARTSELEREPPPHVLQTSLSDFYVQYSLRVRLRDQLQRPAVLSALNANVQDVFNEYGVQIMSPHYLSDPTAPAVVPKERWFEPPAASPRDSSRTALTRPEDGPPS